MSRSRSYSAVWMLLVLFVVIGAIANTPVMRSAAFDALALTRQGVFRGEVWRFVTYPFLTRGVISWVFTVLVFYYIAAPLEAVWGTRRFLTLFGASVIGGGLTGVLLHRPLAGGWALGATLMLIHGFMFPESMIYVFLVLPMRVKTLAIVTTAIFLADCVRQGLTGLALFAGLFCGVLYYVLTTGAIPWVRRAKRRIRQAATNPGGAIRGLSTASLMEQTREIMRRHDSGQPLTPQDRDLIQELVQRSDPAHELCSPYSFSPDNTICPPCKAFGRCLRRYLEAVKED